MAITMHLCRGNFRSSWIAQGGYEPVAEMLFNQIGVDGYFMEFDTERAGGFEPLRFVPKGKTVVLGLVTSKAGALESAEELERRIADAAKYVELDQLCLSPQCGFASTEEGNSLPRRSSGPNWRVSLKSREKCGASDRRDRCRRAARPRALDRAAKAAGPHWRRWPLSSTVSIFRF